MSHSKKPRKTEQQCLCSIDKKHNKINCLKNKIVNKANNEIFNFDQKPVTIKNIWFIKPISIFMMLVSSFLFSLGIIFFLGLANTFPTGMSAIPKLIIIIVKNQTGVDISWAFSLIFLVMNIPFIVWIWVKSSNKQFVIITVCWMLFQIMWNQLFSLDSPFKRFLLDNILISKPVEDNSWQIIYYTSIAAVLSGLGIGIAWKFGGSGGGTDFITYYISSKKRKALGKITFFISISLGILSLIIFYFISYNSANTIQFFGIKTFSLFLYSAINSKIIDKIYPKFGKVLLTIYTSKPEEVVAHFKSIKYWHSYNIWEGQSGYTSLKQSKIETIIFVIEKKTILKEIGKIDKQFWYSTSKIIDTTNRLDSTKLN
ncbi:YitT family protein [Mesomycoplasma conjunctivae]|uniref:YitT family protein n=1 Tax=Mesomycoplasma conjunctivae TaxID=45361 RepID=UPI003DA3BEAE